MEYLSHAVLAPSACALAKGSAKGRSPEMLFSAFAPAFFGRVHPSPGLGPPAPSPWLRPFYLLVKIGSLVNKNQKGPD